jgi:hypothetical protein
MCYVSYFTLPLLDIAPQYDMGKHARNIHLKHLIHHVLF